jgi:hypothetical protein
MYVMEKIKEQKPKLVSNVEKTDTTQALSLIKLDALPTDLQARAEEIKKLNDLLKAEQLNLSNNLKAIKKEEAKKAKEEAKKAKDEEARKEFEKRKEDAKAEFVQKEPDFLKLEKQFLKLKEQYNAEHKKMTALRKIFDDEFNSNNYSSTGRPGVIAEIRKFITGAASDGISKSEILDQLIVAFPERDPEAMKKTINAQLPSRIANEDFQCIKMDNGNYKAI